MPADPFDAARRRRRDVLQSAALVAALAAFAPRGAAAADRSFDATSMSDVLRALGGTPVPSPDIDLELPELTENGAMVPVSVTSRLPRTERIVLLADANPFPLVASFDVSPTMEPFVSTRVKLAQTCTVTAVVSAGGRLWSTSRETAVTVGGCGG